MKILSVVLVAAVVVYWIALLLVAGVVLLLLWLLIRPFMVAERRGTPRTDAYLAITQPRRHPLGHRTTPLEALTKAERRLWDDVRKQVAP